MYLGSLSRSFISCFYGFESNTIDSSTTYNMKHYNKPTLSVFYISEIDLLATSNSQNQKLDNSDDVITCDPSEYGWEPDNDEIILSCHGDFILIKEDGKKIGSAFGKEHYIAEELSSQIFICCVTNKRLILIPAMTKDSANRVLNIGMLLTGIDSVPRKISTSIFLQNYINDSLFFYREDINYIKFSTDFPIVDHPIIIMNCLGHDIFIQCRQEIGKACDIITALNNPSIFMPE